MANTLKLIRKRIKDHCVEIASVVSVIVFLVVLIVILKGPSE